jgi:hypothetical protein
LTHNVKESRIKALLNRTKGENEEVLFHHRYATSTIDIRNACHPFSTKDNFEYQYVGVHNGVVRNSKELRAEHEKMGIKYVSVQENDTFNDSEALIYDLARVFEGQVDSVTAAGSIAFIVVKRDMHGKPLTLFFGHNAGNSTLVMKRTEHSLTISSTGEGDHVPINQLHMFDYETREVRTVPMYLPSYVAGGNTSTYIPAKTNQTYNRDGDKEYPSWDAYRDDDRRFVAATNDATTADDKAFEEKIKAQLKEEFYMRSGDKQEVKQELLFENNNRHEAAALAALMEADEASKEKSLMDIWITKEEDKDAQSDIVDYWANINIYEVMLKTIADELHAEAKVIDAAKKEDKRQKPFGFHSHKVHEVINRTPERLLPSNVLANNNKKLA